MTTQIYVGIDVAKDKLDMGRTDQPHITTVTNDDQGITQLTQQLGRLSPAVIVVEATGGLEQPLLDALLDASLPVALVNPGQVRHFISGMGRLAKTDAIDARMLAEFAHRASPRLSEKRSKNRQELEALVTCRRQLVEVRTEQTNRRRSTRSIAARKVIDKVLATINEQLKTLDKDIRELIQSDDDLSGPDKLLRSVPGVGLILSATLLAELNELGVIGRRQVSALAGVAPFNRDSGRHRGKRRIRGGRTSVRCVLYMATITAIRCNPVIQRFAERMKSAGKPAKVVITACMRKLLTILNAMLRENLQWSQLKLVQNT